MGSFGKADNVVSVWVVWSLEMSCSPIPFSYQYRFIFDAIKQNESALANIDFYGFFLYRANNSSQFLLQVFDCFVHLENDYILWDRVLN